MGIAQPEEAFGFILRRDIALHGGSVGPESAGCSTEQRRHRLTLHLATQIEERRVEPGHGPAQIGTGVFVFSLADQVQRIGEIQRLGAKGMAGNLAVKNLAGDVGVVGGNLAPALRAGFRRRPYEAHEFIAESFEFGNFHGRSLT